MTALHRTLTRPLPVARSLDGHEWAAVPKDQEAWPGELDPVPARVSLGRGDEAAAIQLALRRGVTDANRLADLVFQGRHPERGGRPITRGEQGLTREWLSIRDHVVTPLLAREASAAPAAQAVPTGAFRPVPVESPGGGRIRDKRDPASGDVVTVRGVNGPVPLHRIAAQAWAAMVRQARADGIAGTLLLPVSGYRSSAHQQRLWQRALARYHAPQEARKWVAPPGGSAHQSGRAIDLNLGARNDSANVAKLRQTPAYVWLVANARRFGFYPYVREPWHWEYNPPAARPAPTDTPSSELEGVSVGVHAGRLEVPTVPVLARHRGKAPALVLRWNDMASVPAEIDVVVHLHGYSRPWMSLPRDIEPFSGLDLTPVTGARGPGRSRPTLTLLPRAHFTGARQKGGNLYVYTFPALDGTDGQRDGITKLVRFSLDRFAAAVGGARPRVGRLILTAHSGGGAPLLRILRYQDPHEVHIFDALYWDAGALADWARRHIRRDRVGLATVGTASARAYMRTHGGALRVFYRTGTRRYSRQMLDAISAELGAGLRDWYRVEASSYGHWEIPRNYGWRVLADAAADVPRATQEPATSHELAYEQAEGPTSTPSGVAELAAALARGERDAKRLTDLVFQARHPERGGRPIARRETQLAREWVRIRDDVVRPATLRTTARVGALPPAPPAARAGSPTASQFTRWTPSRQQVALLEPLVPLLERYRGDIPLEFLLGWIAVESGGRIDEVTSLDERGFFQIHPDESKDRGFQHQRLSTDPDYSVQAGIENVRYYARLARQRFPSIPMSSELFWRVVKLQHAMGSGLARRLLNGIRASNIPLTWEAIKQYEVTDGPRLHRLLNPPNAAERGRFGRNVDKVFVLGRQLATALRR
jgi:hypothetical protein